MRMKQTVKEYAILTVGTLVIACAVYLFMIPSHVTVGSISALAMVLSNFIPLPVSMITLSMNIVLLLIGFLLIGREFGAKTVYASILLPGLLAVFENVLPNFQSLTQDPFLDVVCYILIVSVGQAILFSSNASSGGLDIVGKLLNKYFRMELGKALALSGMLVALSSAVCYDKKTVVLSVLGTYFGGVMVDQFIFGMNIKRKVCIISPKLEEIKNFVLHELHSGASINELIGAYDSQPRREIVIIVDNSEYRRLMDYMKKTDPKAFMTVYSVNEVKYQPKKR